MYPLLLVVDDDLDDIEAIQDALLSIPHAPELSYFLNAEGLLKFFKSKSNSDLPPIAISLDINLPGMNGIELLLLLKKDFNLKNIPITIITTSNSPEQRDQCIEYGARNFFTKPINVIDWTIIIQSVVNDIIKLNR